MANRFLEVATTPAVVSARVRWDGRDRYAAPPGTPTTNDQLGPTEAAFLSERDGFYLASVSETGWPYVQFRGGPPGFLHVLGPTTLGYADVRGNRQYLTMGNVAKDDRVALFVVDHLRRKRLKLLGHLSVVDDPAFLASVTHPATNAVVERAVRIEVVAYDWNCPQHLTVRFTEAEVSAAVAPLRARIAALEQELARARGASAPPLEEHAARRQRSPGGRVRGPDGPKRLERPEGGNAAEDAERSEGPPEGRGRGTER